MGRIGEVERLPRRREPDALTRRAVQAVARQLSERYDVQQLIFFGSRARSTHTADSDADLAVLLSGAPQDRFDAVRDMAAVAFDVLMETSILVQAVPLWAEELAHPERTANPALIRNILHDGLRLEEL